MENSELTINVSFFWIFIKVLIKIGKYIIYQMSCPIFFFFFYRKSTFDDIKSRNIFQRPINVLKSHIKCVFGAHNFRSNLLFHVSVSCAPWVSKWKMRCRDDSLLTPLIFAQLGSSVESLCSNGCGYFKQTIGDASILH